MDEKITVEAVIKGYVNRGISSVELTENGHLLFHLTDGSIRDIGKVTTEEPAEIFDGSSLSAPSMKAVADYVSEKISEFLIIDSEVIL